MGEISNVILGKKELVCPWWLCFTFDNIFRRMIHDPVKILQPYIKEGDKILDIGPGIGYFTIPMARMAGENGHVTAIDLQEKMLTGIRKRAKRAHVESRITLQQCSQSSLGIAETMNADFILAFWMVHEVPDKKPFLAQLFSALKKNGRFLIVEPKFHTSEKYLASLEQECTNAGFRIEAHPKIFFSRAVLLTK
jgi:ubiquinone/menaquinone biosynthesis C-methylase UbiE